MKVLILSVCGKLNEPEETKYLNLYFASLKKYVVPFFETKVVLLTTYKIENLEDSLLRKRIKEFELDDVVSLHTIDDLQLPIKSLEIIKSYDWFSRIGMHMNILYDYAKLNNFFDADWIFHTDTDSEFLQDFSSCLNSLNELKKVEPGIFISLAGDAWPPSIIYEGTEYLIKQPDRVDFYDEETVRRQEFIVKIEERRLPEDDYRKKQNHITFSPAQMKIRNDFVGMSRRAADVCQFNWSTAYFPTHNFHESEPFDKFWPQKAIRIEEQGTDVRIVDVPKIHINYHMGGMLLYKFQNNELPVTKIQFQGYSRMMLHHSSGWFQSHYTERSLESLNANYSDTKEIWNKDFE
jgi:hypothetical protein